MQVRCCMPARMQSSGPLQMHKAAWRQQVHLAGGAGSATLGNTPLQLWQSKWGWFPG